MTNLIQNYANSINQGVSKVNSTTKKYYENLTDVNSENLLTPLDGKGYLVKNNLATAPVEMAKDTYYTAKSLQKGIAGKANDHELGKLNDLGLKIGGLTIATYLMTKRSTPKTKAMEFIGFGAFLASMAIWPKVALQWPAQLVHGFNFRKQYVDEQGRKKFVTQDPNYIPFDLYKGEKKSEDLAAIGDKMGISRKQKDRNEVVKDQMRKISVQNNTMWMLTAGIATPIMTALTCNLLDKPVGDFAEKFTNKKMTELADDIGAYMSGANREEKTNKAASLINKSVDTNSQKRLEGLLASKKGQTVTEKDITKISEVLTEGLDTQTRKIAHRDLSYMLVADNTVVNDNTVSDITLKLTEKLDTRYGEGYTASVVDAKKLNEHVSNFMESKGNPKNGILNAQQAEELRLSLGEFFGSATEANTSIRPARKKVIKSLASESVQEAFGKQKVAILSDEAVGHISKAGKILRNYRAVDETISKVTHFKAEKAAETVAGNNWGRVTNTLIKHLNISTAEMDEARSSEDLAAQLFTRKLESLVADKDKYKKAVSEIAKEMLELDKNLDTPRNGKRPVMDILLEGIAKNCDNTANELNNVAEGGSKPFFNLANRFSAPYVNGAQIGSIKDAKINRIQKERVGSIQNAYMRLLHTMDFFKRVNEKAVLSGDANMDKALYEKGKKLLMSSHSGDFFLKFQTANNASFYKALMWHTFGSGNMSKDTLEALGDTAYHQVFTGGKKTKMADRVRGWAVHIKDLMGTTKYDFLPHHLEGNEPASNVEKTAVAKFNKIACTPADMLRNALKQKYNSNKWFRTFATIGAIVFAGTVASQFAFGKKDSTIQTK